MRVDDETDDLRITGADNLDELAQAAIERGLPVRVRLQPTIYRAESETTTGNYVAWRGQVWTMEADTAAGIRRWKEALDLLTRAIALGRLQLATGALRAVVADQGE